MPENLERRGGVWYYRGVINGVLRRRSTGFKDLARARRRANEIEGQLREGMLGWIKAPVPQFGAWAAQYLDAYHATRTTERQLLRRAITRWSTRLLDDIQRSDGEMYLREREGAGAKKGTLERERVLLKGLFKAAIDDGKIEKNPFGAIRAYKPEPRTRVMTRDEEARIRADILPHWDRFITVAVTTGLRAGELRGIRPMDIRDGWLHVRAECNKTRAARRVPLRPETIVALNEQRAATGAGDSTPLWDVSKAAPKAMLARACRRLEIEPRVSIHDLRRTFATRCAEAGMYPKHLQMILGHKRIETTMRFYVHMDQMSLIDAIGKVTL